MMLPNLPHAMAELLSGAGADPQRPARTATPCGVSGGCTTQLCSPAHATDTLADLQKLTTELTVTVARLDRYLQDEHAAGRLSVVEGPFTGDSASAVTTTHLWFTKALGSIAALQEELDHVQIAAGGLAPQQRP